MRRTTPLTAAALLGLLAFAGFVAVGAIFSMAVVAQYVAYSVPIGMGVLARGEDRFERGRFSLGRAVRVFGGVRIVYLLTRV